MNLQKYLANYMVHFSTYSIL